jgi:hypothetical protein
MAKGERQGVTIVSDTGAPMMEMKSIKREGDKLVVVGALMGSWDTNMYISVKDVLGSIKLIMNASVIGYVFSLPWILLRNRKTDKKSRN